MPNIPADWSFSVDNRPSWNAAIKGASSVGAAATDASFFQQFIVIDKNKSLGTPIDTHGEIVVTQDFAAERRIRLERKDFALREARRM